MQLKENGEFKTKYSKVSTEHFSSQNKASNNSKPLQDNKPAGNYLLG